MTDKPENPPAFPKFKFHETFDVDGTELRDPKTGQLVGVIFNMPDAMLHERTKPDGK